MKGGIRNQAASVLERLRTVSRERKEEFQLVLERYTLERLLYRLGLSQHRERFVLKGAMLFAVWGREAYRPTRDLDLLGYGARDPGALAECFREICETQVPDDGLVFLPDSFRAEAIRDETEYGGVRVRFKARMGQARIPVQVDVGFGDAVVPSPEEAEYPAMLDGPPPRIRMYPREAVVAEKFHALITLGEATSRLKDIYDIVVLSEGFPFDGRTLAEAMKATFKSRQTILPASLPSALATRFFEDADRAVQWRAFLNRSRLESTPQDFVVVGERLRAFLWPVVQGVKSQAGFAWVWPQGGPWR